MLLSQSRQKQVLKMKYSESQQQVSITLISLLLFQKCHLSRASRIRLILLLVLLLRRSKAKPLLRVKNHDGLHWPPCVQPGACSSQMLSAHERGLQLFHHLVIRLLQNHILLLLFQQKQHEIGFRDHSATTLYKNLLNHLFV